ncbi:hypothetical protein HDU91_005895, partial [Kappamyces sp. JEL0680]
MNAYDIIQIFVQFGLIILSAYTIYWIWSKRQFPAVLKNAFIGMQCLTIQWWITMLVVTEVVPLTYQTSDTIWTFNFLVAFDLIMVVNFEILARFAVLSDSFLTPQRIFWFRLLFLFVTNLLFMVWVWSIVLYQDQYFALGEATGSAAATLGVIYVNIQSIFLLHGLYRLKRQRLSPQERAMVKSCIQTCAGMVGVDVFAM